MQTLPVNRYGNIDVRHGIPHGLIHVSGARISMTCRSINIEFARALVGWKEGKWGGPIFDGVVIRAEDEKDLLAALERRNTRRLTPAQKLARRKRKHARDANQLANEIRAEFPGMPEYDVEDCANHATEIGSGRIGRSQYALERAYPAVVAYIRHRYTDYDSYLEEGWDRDESRWAVKHRISEIIEGWQNPTTIAEAA